MMSQAAVLAVFAHPDDETFRCGGTLALLARRGVRVQVVTATRGEAGSCGDPPICKPEELGSVREEELRCACGALGIAPPILLDYRDGTLQDADPGPAVAEIVALMRRHRPGVLLTWPSHGLSGHADHCAVSRWVRAAYERVAAEASPWLGGLYHLAVPRSVAEALNLRQLQATPDEDITVSIDVMEGFQEKLAAIRCHRTQLGASPILEAPDDSQRLFLGREHFVRAAGQADEDLFTTLEEQAAD